MKRLALAFLLLMAFSLAVSVAGKSEDGDAAIKQKVEELTEGKKTRWEKIAVLHAFVRDEIAQIKTKYG